MKSSTRQNRIQTIRTLLARLKFERTEAEKLFLRTSFKSVYEKQEAYPRITYEESQLEIELKDLVATERVEERTRIERTLPPAWVTFNALPEKEKLTICNHIMRGINVKYSAAEKASFFLSDAMECVVLEIKSKNGNPVKVRAHTSTLAEEAYWDVEADDIPSRWIPVKFFMMKLIPEPPYYEELQSLPAHGLAVYTPCITDPDRKTPNPITGLP